MRLSPTTMPRVRLLGAAARWLVATPTRVFALALLASVLFGGVYALRLGQDINFDQRNYHFESAYEFLTGRIDVDAAPSGLLHAYFNPLPYVPFYEMARHWRPRYVIFAIGTWDGLNIALAFAIAYRLASGASAARRGAIAGLAAVFSAAGAMTLSEFGSSSTDLSLSPPLLLAVLALVAATEASSFGRALALTAAASALVGVAIGLKLTHATFAFGLALACVIGWRSWSGRLVSLVVSGAAGALGVAISSGFWFLTLWRKFQSPAFPYYDAIFHSPALDPLSDLRGHSFFDARFLPHSWLAAISLPFRWMATGQTTAELQFRDLRFGVLIALFGLALGLWLWRRAQPTMASPEGLRAGEARVLVFVVATFVVWLHTFGIQRYITAIELLLGPCLVIALRFVVPERVLPYALGALALGAAATVIPPDWEHVKPRRDWFAVKLPPLLQKPALVLAPSATSFLGPFLPPDSVMIGLTNAAPLRRGGAGFLNQAFEAAMARKPELPVVLLATELMGERPRLVLGRLGLNFGPACENVPNAAGFVAACELTRSDVGPAAAPPLKEGGTLRFGSTGEGAAALFAGWNADTAWGNIGPGVSPKLIFRGDNGFGDAPIRLTLGLSGFGDLGVADEMDLKVGDAIVAAWPVANMGKELTACAPSGLLKPSAPTVIAFVYRHTGPGEPPRRLGSMGLASVRADKGGCQPSILIP